MPKASLMKVSVLELKRELRRRQTLLARLGKKRRRLAKTLAGLDAEIAALAGAAGRVKIAARRGPARGRGWRARNRMSLGDTLVKVLQGVKSMKVAELVEAVKKQGYRSKAKNFRLIVNQTLVKDKRFRNVRRGRYALSKAARMAGQNIPALKARRKKAVAPKPAAAPETV